MRKLTVNLENLIVQICKIKTCKFVECVNKYALATRYSIDDDKVCEIDNINKKIIHIVAPEYFGIYSHKMRIDRFKKYYIKITSENWANMEKEDQELIFLTFY